MNKPVILLGNGIRGNPELIDYLINLGIPILTTWMAADLIPEDHPAFCGRPGVYGQRAANIIQQKAQEIWIIGARLDELQVAYRIDKFAPNAIKTVVDIDQAELNKLPDNWRKIHGETGNFLIYGDNKWLSWCKSLYNRLRPA